MSELRVIKIIEKNKNQEQMAELLSKFKDQFEVIQAIQDGIELAEKKLNKRKLKPHAI